MTRWFLSLPLAGLFLLAIVCGACLQDAGPDIPLDAATTPGIDTDNPPPQPADAEPAGADPGTKSPAQTTTPPPEAELEQVEASAETPTAAAPVEALIFVDPSRVIPGQAFLLAVDASNASAASVALDGQFISLTRAGDRFFTILPVPVETPPGRLNLVVAVADSTGVPTLQELVSVEIVATDFPVELVKLDTTLARLLDPAVVEEDRSVREAVQRRRSPLRFWQGYFLPPTGGVITSTYGLLRSYNGAEPSDYHSGLDFAGSLGSDVIAANAGLVAWTGETERRGRGIIIDHGGGIFTSYWHLASIDSQQGDAIAAGTLIGRVGNTGLSTGAHLHWELTVHGVAVDPLPWLREQEVPDPAAVFAAVEAVNATGPAIASP